MGSTMKGHGAAVTFDTSSTFDALIDSVSVEGKSTEAIETTNMGSTSKTYMPGDILNPGGLTVSIHADTGETVPVGVEQEITFTYPKKTGQTNGATLVGDGFIVSTSSDFAAGNQKATGQYQIMWSAMPVFTAGS